MITKIDVYRTANLFIQQHGDEAAIQAAMKADEMLAKGDMDGKAIWMRVGKAVEELLSKTPPQGTSLQ